MAAIFKGFHSNRGVRSVQSLASPLLISLEVLTSFPWNTHNVHSAPRGWRNTWLTIKQIFQSIAVNSPRKSRRHLVLGVFSQVSQRLKQIFWVSGRGSVTRKPKTCRLYLSSSLYVIAKVMGVSRNRGNSGGACSGSVTGLWRGEGAGRQQCLVQSQGCRFNGRCDG